MNKGAKEAAKGAITYPSWICLPCGKKWGRRPEGNHIFTIHPDTCGICYQKDVSCTEPRDFGHLKDGWEKDARKYQKLAES